MVVGYHHFRKPEYDSDVELAFHSPARCGDMLLPTTSREIELPKVATGLGTVQNMPTTTIRYRPISMGLLTETDIHMVSLFYCIYIYILCINPDYIVIYVLYILVSSSIYV